MNATTSKPSSFSLLPLELVTHQIKVLRGQRVIVDSELAALYGVETKRFNEAVKRNAEKFPPDFMFVTTAEEFEALRSQIATSNAGTAETPTGRGGRRYLPRVFTELAAPPEPPPKRPIGFLTHEDTKDKPTGITKAVKVGRSKKA